MSMTINVVPDTANVRMDRQEHAYRNAEPERKKMFDIYCRQLEYAQNEKIRLPAFIHKIYQPIIRFVDEQYERRPNVTTFVGLAGFAALVAGFAVLIFNSSFFVQMSVLSFAVAGMAAVGIWAYLN